MSDTYVTFVPKDPRFVPLASTVGAAEKIAAELFPEAEEIAGRIHERIAFFDSGQNFDAVYCPGCGGQLHTDWWHETMDADTDGDGFKLATYSMPCCDRACTLDDLRYEWPQAFGSFGLEVMNPNVHSVPAAVLSALESVVGSPLRVIYQRI